MLVQLHEAQTGGAVKRYGQLQIGLQLEPSWGGERK